eukprot:TRINITY_DN46912_c0_g1_i1.p2 TRINITY_DN46912_c0_g1~~TRINITY_DN46912_c0_g1_i1.p2  ORF type:complete len:134 (+),score=46.14 TRINITY_DN46912_c0_g1_i1:51-404(+)
MVSAWSELKNAQKKTPDAGNGTRVGLKPGFKTTKRARGVNPASRMKLHKAKLAATREIILETAGLSPYERRITELLKVQREKRALRFAKRRLGSFIRAKKKRELMSTMMRKQAAKKK